MTPSSTESHFAGQPADDHVWRWRGTSASGEPVEIPDDPGFPSRGDAETWIGESWRDLVDQGVAAVTLVEEDRVVSGPMSLET